MQTNLINTYVDEVLKFRKALNLTSISDAGLFKDRFIQPSLVMGQWMPESGRMLDIGSGMGVPGIPLLISKPLLTGVLVERRKKRAEFLRHIVRKLKLQAEVYDADICSLPSLHVDVCVARAVADERQLLKMCSAHVNHGAVAVFPVPQKQHLAHVDGWKILDQHSIRIGASENNIQSVRCYQYRQSEHNAGGFT